jgi:hypothetical protein
MQTSGNSVAAFLSVTGLPLFTAVPIILIGAAYYRNARDMTIR